MAEEDDDIQIEVDLPEGEELPPADETSAEPLRFEPPRGAEQPAGQQVQLRVDEREMVTNYANAFRSSATADEVMLDLGMNQTIPPPVDGGTPAMLLKVTQRAVLNYYTAKRLAIALSQIARTHEDQFGVLELDVNRRRAPGQ